jgi:hypothetical protein
MVDHFKVLHVAAQKAVGVPRQLEQDVGLGIFNSGVHAV